MSTMHFLYSWVMGATSVSKTIFSLLWSEQVAYDYFSALTFHGKVSSCKERTEMSKKSLREEVTYVAKFLGDNYRSTGRIKKKLLLPSQLNLSSFSSGCRASFESNCLLISLSSDSLFSQIFKIAIALTPPTARKNTARKYWSERNAISPNSFSYTQIATRSLSVKHTRQQLLQLAP